MGVWCRPVLLVCLSVVPVRCMRPRPILVEVDHVPALGQGPFELGTTGGLTMLGNFTLDPAVSTLATARDMQPTPGRSQPDHNQFHHPRSSACVPPGGTQPRFVVRVASVPRAGSTYLLALLACLGLEAHGTHHPFFHEQVALP